MRLYKLTDQYGYTRRGKTNETLWGIGVSHTAQGEGGLCSSGLIHAYTGAALSLFMNPIHANITNPRLWEAEGEVLASDKGLKVGCKSLLTTQELIVPCVTTESRVLFALYCAKAISKDTIFNEWADRWISGQDRSEKSALGTPAVELPNVSAAWAAVWAASGAAGPAEWAARAAEWAARAARAAARAAAREINIKEIAAKVLKIKEIS